MLSVWFVHLSGRRHSRLIDRYLMTTLSLSCPWSIHADVCMDRNAVDEDMVTNMAKEMTLSPEDDKGFKTVQSQLDFHRLLLVG